jgi:hypothetical protein
MGFDVAPTPVRRRGSRLPAVALLAAGIALVAIAIATTGPGPAPGPTGSANPSREAEAAASTPTPVAPSAPAATVPPRPLRLPRTVECHDLAPATCDEVALTSIAILPPDGPAVAAIDAWGSILCADDLECPRPRLAGSMPLGSAVVSFDGGGARAWVNVVVPQRVAGAAVGEPSAWIVRWQP